MMSTREFLTKWIKQRFFITLIEYLSCILLLNNLLTGSGISIEILKKQTESVMPKKGKLTIRKWKSQHLS